MHKPQLQVQEFHRAAGLNVSGAGLLSPDLKTQTLRVDLIQEELDEFAQAQRDCDIVEIADALADLLYVVYGAAEVYGLDIQNIFTEVHRSNMTKVWPEIKKNEAGKIIKPESYEPPNLISLVFNQIY